MNKQQIKVEADSLKKAREQLKAQIPANFHLLSEKVVSDGKPKTIKLSSDTLEKAFETAIRKVPRGVEIISRKTLSTPEQKLIIIEAFDDKAARVEAKRQIGKTAKVKDVKLVEHGTKGVFGIGKKPNRYEIQVLHPAVVEIVYKGKVKISATISDDSLSKKKKRSSRDKASQNEEWARQLADPLGMLIGELRDSAVCDWCGKALSPEKAYLINQAFPDGRNFFCPDEYSELYSPDCPQLICRTCFKKDSPPPKAWDAAGVALNRYHAAMALVSFLDKLIFKVTGEIRVGAEGKFLKVPKNLFR